MSKFDDISLFGPRKGAAKAAPSSFQDSEQIISLEILESDGDGTVLFESGGSEVVVIELIEQAALERRGDVWRVTVIEEGWSLNRRYYPRRCLQEAEKIWEQAKVCAYGWDPSGRHPRLDHVPPHIERMFPKGTFLNEVGFLKNVAFVLSESGPGRLVADFCVTDTATREALLATERMGGRLPGFSIHGEGETRRGIAEGREGVIVTRITASKELTIVSDPAAGGRFERLAASIQHRKEEPMNPLERLRQYLAKKFPTKRLREGVSEMGALEVCQDTYDMLKESGPAGLLKLAQKWMKAGKTDEAAEVLDMAISEMEGGAAPEPMEEMKDEEEPVYEGRAQRNVRRGEGTPSLNILEEMRAELAEARKESSQALQELAVSRAQTQLNTLLSESNLPDLAQTQIRESFTGREYKKSDLEKRISDTKELLAIDAGGEALIEGEIRVGRGSARSYGDPRVTILYEGQDTLEMATDLLFSYDYEKAFELGDITESQRKMYRELDHPRTYSPRTIYTVATGDWDGRNRVMPGSLMESMSLRESATTASFPNLFGTSMTKALAIIFRNEEAADWGELIKQVDVDSFKQQDRIVAGSFSSLPDVAEGTAYTDLGVPLELPTSYSLGKKGGFFRFTWESMLSDDLNYYQSIIPSIVDAGIHTRDRSALRLITGFNNTYTSYDGTVHYHANHFNLTANALSHAAVVTAEQMLLRTRKPAFRTLLNGAMASTSSTTFTVDSTAGMQVGDYVQIDAEVLEVTAVTNTTTVELARGALQTTAATHADNAPAITLGGTLNRRNMQLHLVVPIALKNAAEVINGSEFLPGSANNDINPLRNRLKIHAYPEEYMDGDFNDWFLMCGHRTFTGLEFAYLNGQRSPEILVQDQPTVGTNFTNDQITYRTRYVFGGKGIYHQGRVANRVA